MLFHPYGLLISLGLLAGLAVAWWRKKVYGITQNDLENLFILTVPLGIIGARIYHVLDKWSYYSQNPGQIFAVWNGGLGIYGGVLGGLVGLGIFLRIKNFKLKILNLLDFLMPSLAIGQAIGRWGNFFNHEVFGPPTTLPWGWYIPANLRPEMWKNYSFFQPTFAYESLWVLIGFFILLIIEFNLFAFLARPRKSNGKEGRPSSSAVNLRGFVKKGALEYLLFPFLNSTRFTMPTTLREPNKSYGFLTGFYCIWYGMGRFFFEFLRFDTAEIWGIKTAQIISLLLIIFGIWQIRRAIRVTNQF